MEQSQQRFCFELKIQTNAEVDDECHI